MLTSSSSDRKQLRSRTSASSAITQFWTSPCSPRLMIRDRAACAMRREPAILPGDELGGTAGRTRVDGAAALAGRFTMDRAVRRRALFDPPGVRAARHGRRERARPPQPRLLRSGARAFSGAGDLGHVDRLPDEFSVLRRARGLGYTDRWCSWPAAITTRTLRRACSAQRHSADRSTPTRFERVWRVRLRGGVRGAIRSPLATDASGHRDASAKTRSRQSHGCEVRAGASANPSTRARLDLVGPEPTYSGASGEAGRARHESE
jgi:hypothetical protein